MQINKCDSHKQGLTIKKYCNSQVKKWNFTLLMLDVIIRSYARSNNQLDSCRIFRKIPKHIRQSSNRKELHKIMSSSYIRRGCANTRAKKTIFFYTELKVAASITHVAKKKRSRFNKKKKVLLNKHKQKKNKDKNLKLKKKPYIQNNTN